MLCWHTVWNSVKQPEVWLEANEKYCRVDFYVKLPLNNDNEGGDGDEGRITICLSVSCAYFRDLFEAMLEAVKSEKT